MNEILFTLGLKPTATPQEAVAVIVALQVAARTSVNKLKAAGMPPGGLFDVAMKRAEAALDRSGIPK